MSELDADLYGDLYGNDEAEFSGTTDAVELRREDSAYAPADSHAEGQQATSSKAPEQKKVPIPAPISKQEPVGESTFAKQDEFVVSPTPQPIPTTMSPTAYTPQVTQQIPTYQQPQPSDYDISSFQTGDNGYQRGQMPERTIRPSEMKDEGKMFIGGLNWDTTDESLRNYFSQFGKVDACTIMRDAAGRSRCFAFLTFEEPASVNAVMVREHFLDGKIIDPKRAIPRQEHQRATKLFIGGLAGSVTSESMREFFSQFGKVIDSTVMLDRETGRSKGFGFISFEDTNVQPFLGFGNLEIDGKMIDVKLAQPRYQRDGFPEEKPGGGYTKGGYQEGGYSNTTPNVAAAPAGNTPFDPQALAQLYTRMFQMAGGGAMNPAMMGMGGMGVNNMMGGMGAGAGGFAGGMGMGRGMGGPGAMGMGAGMGGMGAGMGMGAGAAAAAGGAGGMAGMGRGGGGGGQGMVPAGPASMNQNQNQNIPRGPRNPPTGPAAGAAGVGPQRAGPRGQHSYHPYAR